MLIYGSLNILWHCLPLGLGWKLTFSSPVATAEISKFTGILSAALPQHHLLGFCITTNCGKFLKRWEYQTTLPDSWEICMWVKKQQLEPDTEQGTGSKLGKEYDKVIYRHLAYLTSMQSTWFEMPGWMNHKLESRLLGKYQQPQKWRWYHSNGRKWRGTN